jgi:hypothetical protein
MKKCSMLKHTGYKWDTNQNDIGLYHTLVRMAIIKNTRKQHTLETM